MSHSAKFFFLQVTKLAEANDFFRDRLGMDTEQTLLEGSEKCILVRPDLNTNIFLSEKKHNNQTNKIMLTTDDLLEDYCRLKANGIEFTKKPAYLKDGLSAEFSDPYGNAYVILEHRNYNEDF